jgi:uncharacterized protein YjbI with pentapeptide repeats
MDHAIILQELEKGAKVWNLWRKRQAVGEINLDGIVLSGMNLDDYDLSKVSLRNAHITLQF